MGRAPVLIYMCESERKRKQGRERGNVGEKEGGREGDRELHRLVTYSQYFRSLLNGKNFLQF